MHHENALDLDRVELPREESRGNIQELRVASTQSHRRSAALVRIRLNALPFISIALVPVKLLLPLVEEDEMVIVLHNIEAIRTVPEEGLEVDLIRDNRVLRI